MMKRAIDMIIQRERERERDRERLVSSQTDSQADKLTKEGTDKRTKGKGYRDRLKKK